MKQRRAAPLQMIPDIALPYLTNFHDLLTNIFSARGFLVTIGDAPRCPSQTDLANYTDKWQESYGRRFLGLAHDWRPARLLPPCEWACAVEICSHAPVDRYFVWHLSMRGTAILSGRRLTKGSCSNGCAELYPSEI